MPLPKRSQTGNNKLQLALLIREGRRAAQELAAGISAKQEQEELERTRDREGEGEGEGENSVGLSTTAASPDMDIMTSESTVLEKDFTVEGKKGVLACPFSPQPNQDGDGFPNDGGVERVDVSQDPASPASPASPHNPTTPQGLTQRPTPTTRPSDPICAAMLNDQTSAATAAAVPPSCPIRYLDKHTPEEIAQYVETHKHSIPRSHEVCVRRYQRNEDQIRKLDAKYGSLVNMVKDLSHLHRPMMPPSKAEQREADRASNQRVEDWANTVVVGSSPEIGSEPGSEAHDGPDGEAPNVDDDREGHFDRPMRDVRVGESPSRPWGISVPLEAGSPGLGLQQPEPPSVQGLVQPTEKPATAPADTPRKCPFDHTKMFPGGTKPVVSKTDDNKNKHNDNDHSVEKDTGKPSAIPETRLKPDASPPPWSTAQPTFVNLADVPAASGVASASAQDKGDRPQVVFNISGPVFIGYPMEQAMEFMRQFQGR